VKNYKFLFSFALILFSFYNVIGQTYYKYPVVNYTPKNYGKNQNAQNWAVTQSNEGLIYSGSSNGLIEFDGYKWNFLPARTGWTYSVACDSNNTLFVGGQSYFGCFLKDSLGGLYYEALSEKLLPKDHVPITNIWRTFAGKDRVYFQSNEAIYVYDYKTLKEIKPETSFHLSAFCNNQLFVRERQKGLMKMVNDKLVLIPNSQLFAEYGVFGVQPYKKDELLITTQEKGLYIYNTQTDEFKEYITKDNSIWYNAKLLGCMRLKNGDYVFNSQFYGSILFNPTTQKINFINSSIGLQDDYVIAQFEDRTGNLWLALNSGLSKVHLRSSLQSYTSMQGSVNDAIKFNNKIYAGTSNGIFIKSEQDADFIHDLNFAPQTVWQLAVNNNKLYAVTDGGLFEYDGKNYKKIINGNFRKVKFLKNGKILIGGTSDVGLTLYSQTLKEEYNFIFEITGEILGIEEAPSENSKNFYWVSTQSAVYKITDDGSPVFKVDAYGEDFGLPNDWKYPFLFNNKIVIGNHSGLFELQKDAKGIMFETTSFYKFETAQNNFSFIKDNGDKTLAIINNQPHIIYKKDGKEIYTPFLPIDMGKENALYYEDGNLYICLEEGLVLFDESKLNAKAEDFEIIVRKISTKSDSILFEGTKINNYSLQQHLNYRFNELTIEFASNYLYQEDKTLYRYKLEGADTSFSAWQTERKIKFNNLHEGHYKLIIQAKNIYEQQSKDLVVEFTILPPWYRTTLAYILYVVGFGLVLFFSIKIASYRLKAQNKHLDNLVKERTKEIEHKNEELKEQNEQILHQKQEITDSINYAKRIQNAILPPLAEIKNSWEKTFVFFQPKDIVSGDFYWYNRIDDNEFLIASADCTGHGVPGGFMSMVCSDKLNEAVNLTNEPDAILKMVNKRIKQSLRQDNKEGSTKDGMEIALLKVNTQNKTVKYSGANRFLWIIRADSHEVEEIKPTKAGIGGHTDDSQEFNLHEIQFQSGDRLYMSTDGFGDQFGGPDGKKLMTKSFKQFLVHIKDLTVDEQANHLKEHINKWMGNLEQVDDILVIGIKM
jgi:serine phosphatase RsbU (regulator of sigma subunit)